MDNGNKINSIDELLKILGVNSIKEIGESPVALAKLSQIDSLLPIELIINLLKELPKFYDTFIEIILSIEGVADPKNAKEDRLKILTELVKSGIIKDEDMSEVMHIILEKEENEKSDGDQHSNNALTIIGGAIGGILLTSYFVFKK